MPKILTATSYDIEDWRVEVGADGQVSSFNVQVNIAYGGGRRERQSYDLWAAAATGIIGIGERIENNAIIEATLATIVLNEILDMF